MKIDNKSFNEKNKNKNKETEIYDNLEIDDKKDELIKIKRNKKSKSPKTKFLFILINIFIILLILQVLYLILYNNINNKNNNKTSNNYESNKNKDKINVPEINIKYIHTINNTNEYLNDKKFPFTDIFQFSSDNIISADTISIFIYDKNYNLIQKIPVFDISDGSIYQILSLGIKDDNNFAIGCNEQSMKIYTKKNDIFILKQDIKNAHDRGIRKVLYNSEGNIISCSYDKTIKIWELDNNGDYINKKIIKSEDEVRSLLLLEDKNILVSSGDRFTNIWDIKNDYKLIKTFNETYCRTKNVLERISDDVIAVAKAPFFLKIISLKELKVIKIIEMEFGFNSIKSFEDKGLFLVGGFNNGKKCSSTIKIFRNDNYEEIETIYDTHKSSVEGFSILNNGLICSYSYDNIIQIWSLD